MVCCLSQIQGPVQAVLRPGLWCLCCQFLRCHREKWVVTNNLEDHLSQIRDAVEKLQETDDKTTYEISKINAEGFVQIYCYTRAEWLDVMEIDFKTGKVWSFSSGLFPTWVPLCFIWNSLLFFMPFYDWKKNEERVTAMRTALGLQLNTD